jgi:regulator of sirC expression with transglutaminase-like and TPR domain
MSKKRKKEKPKERGGQATEQRSADVLQLLDVRIWSAASFAAVITFAVFLPALSNDFVNWDDYAFIIENSHIRTLNFDSLKWIFTNREHQWSPLRWISHWIDYKIWHLNPMGHHLSSVIFHSLNTFLIVLIVLKIFEIFKNKRIPSLMSDEERRFRKRALIAGVMTGLLFGLHPLRVESVVWVAERKDVLYSFFFLFSLLWYMKYSTSSQGKQGYYYLFSLSCFIMAAMSKAMAITLPLVLILLDIYPLRKVEPRSFFKTRPKVFIEKLPFFIVSAAVTLINMNVHEKSIVPLEANELPSRALIVFKSLSFYLFKMLWPFHLAPYYPYPSKMHFLAFEYSGPFILVTAITLLCIYLWRKGKRHWLIIWAYYIVMLLPVMGIVRFGSYFAADRYTYLASLGPFLLAGMGISFLWDTTHFRANHFFSGKNLIILVCIGIFTFLSVLTVRQIAIWRNSITLWTHEIERYPNHLVGYECRGSSYYLSGDFEKALDDLNRAIQIFPRKDALKIRGDIYIKSREYQKALQDFNKAIELDPEFSAAYNNRCGLNLQLGDYPLAIKDCSRVLEIDPKDAMAYNNRGFAHFSLGDYSRALTDYTRAIELNPQDPGFYLNRGAVYLALKENDSAMRDFRSAAKLGDHNVQDLLFKKGIR